MVNPLSEQPPARLASKSVRHSLSVLLASLLIIGLVLTALGALALVGAMSVEGLGILEGGGIAVRVGIPMALLSAMGLSRIHE